MTLNGRYQTARLVLRPLAASDEVAIIQAIDNIEVSRWLTSVPHPYRADDFQYFLSEVAKPGETFVIEDDAGLAGVIGLERGFGYWLAPRAWGKGYATEAARALLLARFAADPSDMTTAYLAGNQRSARVLQKLGFVETGPGTRFGKALGKDMESVELNLTLQQFRAALPLAAHSARMGFRPIQPVDAADLHEIVRHWDVTRQFGPHWPWPADPAYSATRSVPFSGAGFVWGIVQGPRLIGTVAVTDAELGYSLHPDFWGQGLVTEACQTALNTAFSDPAVAEIKAEVWADNVGSLRVLAKLGFQRVGDHFAHSHSRPEGSPGYDLLLTRQAWQGA